MIREISSVQSYLDEFVQNELIRIEVCTCCISALWIRPRSGVGLGVTRYTWHYPDISCSEEEEEGSISPYAIA